MKVFLDTNVLLDALVRRDNPQFTDDASLILELGYDGVCDLCMSVLSVPTIAYVLKSLSPAQKQRILRDLSAIVTLLPSLPDHISAVLENPVPDIEDALQLQSALQGSCDLILTRDPSGFAASALPVLTPSAFLSRILSA